MQKCILSVLYAGHFIAKKIPEKLDGKKTPVYYWIKIIIIRFSEI